MVLQDPGTVLAPINMPPFGGPVVLTWHGSRGERERATFHAKQSGGREHTGECLRPVVYSSLIGFTSCIVKSVRSRRSFISSHLWTP